MNVDISEEFFGYNIFCIGPKFFAVFQGVASFDPEAMDAEEVGEGEVFVADNLDALHDAVRVFNAETGLPPGLSDYRICEPFEAYNVMIFGNIFFAVIQGILDVPPDRILAGKFEAGIAFHAISLETLQDKITNFKRSYGVPDRFKNVRTETRLDDFGLPEIIEIEPMEKCNLRCIMCPQGYDEDNIGKARIRPDFYKRLKGLEGKLVVMGANNEPTTHPQFMDIVRGLSDIGMSIDLTTNGTLNIQKKAGLLADCNFSNVVFSFDGMHKETFESIRLNANYERTLERILEFRQVLSGSDVFFTIQYILMQRTLGEVVEAVDFWEKHEFHHMGLLGLIIGQHNDLLLAESLEPVMDKVQEVMKAAALRIIENRYRMTLSSSFVPQLDLRSKYPQNFLVDNVRSDNVDARLPFNARTFFQNGPFPGMHVDCRSPFKYARIYFDGTVRLCAQFEIGNIYDNDFVDIWYGKQAEKVRRTLMRGPEVCHECDYFKHCLSAGSIDRELERNQFFGEAVLKDYKPASIRKIGAVAILSWRGRFFCVPEIYGDYDVRLYDKALDHEVHETKTLGEAITLAREIEPWLAQTFLYYNITRVGGIYVGIRFGDKFDSSDIDKADDMAGVVTADDLISLKIKLIESFFPNDNLTKLNSMLVGGSDGYKFLWFPLLADDLVHIGVHNDFTVAWKEGAIFGIKRSDKDAGKHYRTRNVSDMSDLKAAIVEFNDTGLSEQNLVNSMAALDDTLDQGNRWFAVRPEIEDFDIQIFNEGGYKNYEAFCAQAKEVIKANVPVVVVQKVGAVSILSWKGLFFCVPSIYGDYDVKLYDEALDHEVRETKTLDDAITAAREIDPWVGQTFLYYNIARINGLYVGIRFGVEFDSSDVDKADELVGVFTADDLISLKIKLIESFFPDDNLTPLNSMLSGGSEGYKFHWFPLLPDDQVHIGKQSDFTVVWKEGTLFGVKHSDGGGDKYYRTRSASDLPDLNAAIVEFHETDLSERILIHGSTAFDDTLDKGNRWFAALYEFENFDINIFNEGGYEDYEVYSANAQEALKDNAPALAVLASRVYGVALHVVETRDEYNVLHKGEKWFAVRHGIENFDIALFYAGEYDTASATAADSQKAVEEAMRGYIAQQKYAEAILQFVEEKDGYNILHHGMRWFAVRHGVENFEIARFETGDYDVTAVASADSLEAVEEAMHIILAQKENT